MQPLCGTRHSTFAPRSERFEGPRGPSFSCGEAYIRQNYSVFKTHRAVSNWLPMNTEPLPSAHPDRKTWLVLGSGIVVLAVAMGIGRFAFTPLMPLMMRDGTLSAVGGAEWVAAANYGGYLVGALTASWFSSNPRAVLCWACLASR